MPVDDLLEQVRHVARLKHLSIRTEEAYVYYVRSFAHFHKGRHPRQMGAEEVVAFLSHLAVEREVAASTYNVALSALLFLYRDVLQLEMPALEGVARAQLPARLPVVFTREEVRAVLDGLSGSPYLMAGLLYGAGLRLMECVRLRVKDLDFEYGQITVRDGKGETDRRTLLPRSLEKRLREQLEVARAWHQEDLALTPGTAADDSLFSF